MTRGCHPDCENPQTDRENHEEKGEGIASYAIVKIPSKIWPHRPTEPKSDRKCPHNAAQ
jgi:hypothetical protein